MQYSAKQYVRWCLNILVAVLTIVFLVFVGPVLIGLFLPFIIGWIISRIANPLVKFLEEKLKIQRKAVSVIVIVLVLGIVIGIGYLIITKLVSESIGFAASFPDMIAELSVELKLIGNRLSIFYNRLPANIKDALLNTGEHFSDFIGNSVENIGTPTILNVGSAAKNIPTIIIGIIMSVLSAYAFIAEKELMSKWLKKNVPKGIQERWNVLSQSIKQAVGGYFKAQLIIEMWVYLLLVIGLAVLKIKYALLIALIIAILDFLPMFGAGLIMLPWALVKFLSGDYKLGIGLLIIWGVGQLVRQIIQPKIMGDSIGFDMIPTLILLYIGYRCYGVVGMLLILPIGIIIRNMNKAGMFDTTKNSLRLLVRGFNNFRRLTPEEIESLEEKKD